MNKKERVKKIVEQLAIEYPDAKCSLIYDTPLELLVATQLAAQCTDARVNIVTGSLFKKYKNINDFADANLEELEEDIKSTGFYRNKAKNIINACKMLITDFSNEIPDTMDDLLKLPGVGRKTANLILGEVYKKSAIVVDTHCIRLTNRMGFTKNKNPKNIEEDLLKIIHPKLQLKFCHLMVFHGRNICKARKPDCKNCSINQYCEKNI